MDVLRGTQMHITFSPRQRVKAMAASQQVALNSSLSVLMLLLCYGNKRNLMNKIKMSKTEPEAQYHGTD